VDCQMSQIGTSSCIQISGATKSASESCGMNCSVNKALSNDHYVDTLRVPRDNMLMNNVCFLVPSIVLLHYPYILYFTFQM
jgi:hypothetical protein